MNEEMRKEFEEWFCNEYSHGGGIPNYGCSTTNIAWKAWQASREAMKPIRFPGEIDIDIIGDQVANSHANSYAEGYNDALSELELKITEFGYKVSE